MKRHGENVIDLRHYREQRMRARRYASPLSAATHERMIRHRLDPLSFPISGQCADDTFLVVMPINKADTTNRPARAGMIPPV